MAAAKTEFPISICLLDFIWRVKVPIRNLPFFHGAQWGAMVKHLAEPDYKTTDFGMPRLTIQTVDTGVSDYEPEHPISIAVSGPPNDCLFLYNIISKNKTSSITAGHFQPGRTIELETVKCRISGEIFRPGYMRRLDYQIIENEINKLCKLNRFTLQFYSPLRIPRPAGAKTEGHHYCDENYFLADVKNIGAIDHFISRIRLPLADSLTHRHSLQISGGSIVWIDAVYGEGIKKNIGGIIGFLDITGSMDKQSAERLVIGQYTGAGKNAAFGLGFYRIPELDDMRIVKNPYRAASLCKRAFSIERLRRALYSLPESSPGIDGITINDIKKEGTEVLRNIISEINNNSYTPGPMKQYQINKEDGTYRDVFIQNVKDRLVHRTVSDMLAPGIDKLLSVSSYAYRRGLNRQGAASALHHALNNGYTCGIKADISAFFDSVQIELLEELLTIYYPFEILTDHIKSWLHHFQKSGIHGLLQGSPLSPLLSNLYLDTFDRDMERQEFQLIRYADDFVLLSKERSTYDETISSVSTSLGKLGLTLKPDKTTEIGKDAKIHFLGYLVSKDAVTDAAGEKGSKSEWLPVFREHWFDGIPIYITSLSRGAYTSGEFLIINEPGDRKSSVPWNKICRIVVVGRSGISGGVVYRAVKQHIPIVFIDVMGRARGWLYPELLEYPDIAEQQKKFSEQENFKLQFAREIISAKINNSYILLRRNGVMIQELRDTADKAEKAYTLESLRGYEGRAAKLFFGALANIVVPFEFKGRVYRPPDGPVNVMLSFGYTLLYNRIATVLRSKGFNPRIGFFHTGRGNHAALASDLLEELRHISERITLALIHRKEINAGDFRRVEQKGTSLCRLSGEGFRKYFRKFEKTMTAETKYPGGDKISYNAYIDEMVDKLRRSMKLKTSYKALRIE